MPTITELTPLDEPHRGSRGSQSFQDPAYFPSFRACLGDSDFDPDYLSPDPSARFVQQYRKHWCLLAGITGVSHFVRPRAECLDRFGTAFPVTFHSDEDADQADLARAIAHLRPGNTLVVFYAMRHLFLDGTIGLRIEDSEHVMTLPLSLDEVFEMNRQVVELSLADETATPTHRCHYCGAGPANVAARRLLACDNERKQSLHWAALTDLGRTCRALAREAQEVVFSCNRLQLCGPFNFSLRFLRAQPPHLLRLVRRLDLLIDDEYPGVEPGGADDASSSELSEMPPDYSHARLCELVELVASTFDVPRLGVTLDHSTLTYETYQFSRDTKPDNLLALLGDYDRLVEPFGRLLAIRGLRSFQALLPLARVNRREVGHGGRLRQRLRRQKGSIP
ncbi:hypothetical protein HK405_003303 [Cladochytrium tenue]|nr:hypothetical protein HK405_003303 [Cladochytrium tenue]